MMKVTVDKTDNDRERMMSLISAMRADNQITADQFMEVGVRVQNFCWAFKWYFVVFLDFLIVCEICILTFDYFVNI